MTVERNELQQADLLDLGGLASGEELTRRRLLQGAVAVGTSGLFLAACGGSRQPARSTAAGKSVRGGTLTVGVVTGGTAETLNPGVATVFPDLLRVYQLFDRLFENAVTNGKLGVEPSLALSAEPSKNARVWTVKLRPGVTWHDGKPFTADDVLWSVAGWSKSSNYASAYAIGRIDFAGVRKLDQLTVEIPLIAPLAEFPSVVSQYNFSIVQHGATPKSLASRPIGTGPFKFVSFTPGTQSVFAANPHYWQSGKPYVDKVIVNSSFTDETTRQNAFLSGQLDAMILAVPSFAKAQQSNPKANVLLGGVSNGHSSGAVGVNFTMRVDKGPFSDVRVRQAFKLIADRPQLINAVYDGLGAIGNDTWGFGTQYFDASLTPSHDPEKARSLLKAAGHEGMSFTLPTSVVTDGFVQAATVFAQQAAQAGVKATVQQISPSTYFTSAGGFLSRPFGVDEGATYPSMTTAYLSFLAKGAPYNETHWADTGIIAQAMAATDPAKAQELWAAAQTQQVKEGGYILWVNAPWIDVASTNLHGTKASAAGPLNGYRLLDIWKA